MQTLYIFSDDDGNGRAALVTHDSSFDPTCFDSDKQKLRDKVTGWRDDDIHFSIVWPDDSDANPVVLDEYGDEAVLERIAIEEGGSDSDEDEA